MKDKTMVEFEKIYLEQREKIFRVCAVILRDNGLAEDAMQETFYKALRRYGRFRGKSNVRTWLTSIAVNECRDRLRKKSSYETPSEDVDILSYNQDNIDSRLSVAEAVRSLPEQLREVVVLYYYQEFTHKEIAEILGLSVPNVAYRLRTAKLKLRDFLGEDDYE